MFFSVFASWYDRRNTTDGSNYEYYGRLSTDNGATWQTDQAISDSLINNYRPVYVNPNRSAVPSVKLDHSLSSTAKLSGFFFLCSCLLQECS